MQPPNCRLCGAAHWSREPCKPGKALPEPVTDGSTLPLAVTSGNAKAKASPSVTKSGNAVTLESLAAEVAALRREVEMLRAAPVVDAPKRLTAAEKQRAYRERKKT